MAADMPPQSLLTALGSVFLGPRVFELLRYIRYPVLLAFSTTSSEAAYPKTLEQLERFGCSTKIARGAKQSTTRATRVEKHAPRILKGLGLDD